MEKFIVTLNCHAHYGYVEYDPATKTAKTPQPKRQMFALMCLKQRRALKNFCRNR